jgi:tetratricopeptide (TPR) repeat protein
MDLLIQNGNLKEAVPYARRVYEIKSGVYGEEHEEVARALVVLATAMERAGDGPGAEVMFRKVMGMNHKDRVARLQGLLGVVRVIAMAGEFEDAVSRFLEVYEAAGPVYVEASRVALSSTARSLTRMLNLAKKPAVAVWFLKGVLETFPEGLERCAILGDLATSLIDLRMCDEAVKVLISALTAQEAVLPAHDLDIITNRQNLAMSLSFLGHRLEAFQVISQALRSVHPHDGIRASIAECHNNIRNALAEQATLLNKEGLGLKKAEKYAEAEAKYREALTIRRTIHPAGHHPDIAQCLHNLSVTLLNLRRIAEAVPLLEEALSIRQGALPQGDPATALTAKALQSAKDAMK